jgi:DNA-binding PadR family transcriptional regulator
MTKKHLGELEQMVMLAVLQADEDAYGTKLLGVLQERGDRKVSPGALYSTLDRLEGKGMLASTYGDPEPGRGGKAKRFMQVTPAGAEALRAARSTWARMSEGLDEILEEG